MLIESIASDVQRINERLDLLTLMSSAILVFAVAAAVMSALTFGNLKRSRRYDSRNVSHGYRSQNDNFTDFNRQAGSGRVRNYEHLGDVDTANGREEPIAPTSQPAQPPPERPPRGNFAPKTPSQSNKNYIAIDSAILMYIGATCLNFPQSIDEVRRLWIERGGDHRVEIVGYGERGDEPSVILVGSREGGFFGVPNTNDWASLSETGLFDPDGRVGPGTRVRELKEVAQMKRSQKGVFTLVQEGRVRVDL